MKLNEIPFQTTDWAAIAAMRHADETGAATWRTREVGHIRLRMPEYSPGYRADRWRRKGQMFLVLEGELETELEDGRRFLLGPGTSAPRPSGRSSSSTSSGAGVPTGVRDGVRTFWLSYFDWEKEPPGRPPSPL